MGAAAAGAGTGRWWVVVPVRDTRRGKSRILLDPGSRARLARAVAADTIAAAVAAPGVRAVLAVTETAGDADLARHSGARAVTTIPRGLAAAVRAGLATAPSGAAVAVLLGDVPALSPEALGQVLAGVRPGSASFVRDADGAGTTLVAIDGTPARTRFGPGSARLHAAIGLVDAVAQGPVPASIRRDVDTLADLAELADAATAEPGLRPGSRTWALLTGPVGRAALA